jgi:hypothetical protein
VVDLHHLAKNTFTLGRADYKWQCEPTLFGWKDGSRHYWCGALGQGDVWFADKPRVKDPHPITKPVELVERVLTGSLRLIALMLSGEGLRRSPRKARPP